MNEFSMRPFVAGSLVGIRSFKVDGLGRLKGVNVPEVWRPGENAASCRKDHGSPISIWLSTTAFTGRYSCSCGLCAAAGVQMEPIESATAKRKAQHDVAALACACGYYAYFDQGDNPYHKTGQLHGLVEGYGVVTVGSRGFRCQKAKLLALVIKPKQETALTDAVRRNYPDVAVFSRKRDAFERFPLVAPDPVTPENTPDFWDRAS